MMEGKTILITGANRGIGKSLAKNFSNIGANVILLGKNEDSLNEVYDEIISCTKTKPLIIESDLNLLDLDGAHQIKKAIVNQYGVLDGLIYNAAKLGKMTSIEDYEDGLWKEIINTNLNSSFLIYKELIPILKAAPSGRIIFTSSGVAEVGKAYWGAYSVSKFAVKGLAEVIRDELDSTSNIKVFNYDPGATKTSMRASAYPGEDPNNLKDPDKLFGDYLWFFSEESQNSTQHYFKYNS
ncbi:MAG: SDR family NAD(P)-dependent oxidoreductase [SAR86 cluster bacterium]|uniref:SDR family NAD(P)-dependent oxidoreductase n=1 Tax=SAR86 cluster bacterium TaxID=2030880 RepID=A0A368C6W0_9GAMM|nr:MAG: SDR family NAD(P)-dependent oxidoreductase [SAR86 cluster bacterium]|tara:strand:- start:147 stop:863 length:717 start_codon:yes stop_codon:yes gene_type:complete